MKLTVQRKHLVELLTKCSGVTKQKSPHASLQCVRLKASMLLEADATDLYHYISTRTAAQVDAPGETLVNCRDLLERVKTLAEGPVLLALDGEKLRITAGKRKHMLTTLNASEFPGTPPTLPEQWLELTAGAFVGLLERVVHAVATESERPSINAVFLELGNGKLSATTTDGRRLAYDLIDAGSGHDKWLLPLAAAQAMLSAIGQGSTMIGIAGDQLQVKSGDVLFASKLTADVFPPIRDQMMSIQRAELRAPRKELLDAVSAVAMASDGIVRFAITNGQMKLRAEGHGESEDELDIVYDGRDVEVCMMAGYVREALSSLATDAVVMSITGDLDPVFLAEPESMGFRLVMPCRP